LFITEVKHFTAGAAEEKMGQCCADALQNLKIWSWSSTNLVCIQIY